MTKEEMMRELTKTVSHPEFDRLLREIQKQPPKERVEYARQNATIEELEKRKIPLPDTFRICVRMFENTDEPSENLYKIDRRGDLKVSDISVCASVGMIICASVGATIPLPEVA